METIGELLRSQKVIEAENNHTGDYGIEVETESKNPYEYPKLKYWNCVRDNSLRNYGCEYVAKAPFKLDEARVALREIEACNKEFKFIKDSISTSVHVHINMLNEKPLTLANFLTAYALVENLLIRVSGPDRLSNLFCLPLKDAEGNLENMEQILKGFKSLNYKRTVVSNDRAKYAALNVVPLTALGTVEARSFRGETDVDVIYEWLTILDDLKNFSRSEGLTPKIILELYKKMEGEIVFEIFKNTSHKIREGLELKQVDKMISHNLWYAAKLAVVMDKWESNFGIPKPKKVFKAKIAGDLESIAKLLFNAPYEELDLSCRIVVQERYMRTNPRVTVVDMDGDL